MVFPSNWVIINRDCVLKSRLDRQLFQVALLSLTLLVLLKMSWRVVLAVVVQSAVVPEPLALGSTPVIPEMVLMTRWQATLTTVGWLVLTVRIHDPQICHDWQATVLSYGSRLRCSCFLESWCEQLCYLEYRTVLPGWLLSHLVTSVLSVL